MQQKILHHISDVLKKHSIHKRWRKVVSVLMCIVVFFTTYAMILPAITMEQDTYCGMEEHTHDKSCYEKKLICDKEEDTQETHIHTDDCYEEETELICDKEETKGHIHTADCITSEQVLVCEDTAEEHEHGEACYETVESYNCRMEEGEGAHTHDESCYKTNKKLVCELSDEEVSGHKHTDECYEEVLVCDKEEHTHSRACFSNPEADLEDTAIWERSLFDVELTGVWSEDIIAVAKSQIGYHESSANYVVEEDGTERGYNRYGAWYGNAYGDWCAMFVSFCLNYAEISNEDVPYDANCTTWIEELTKKEMYQSAKEYTPKKGDLVFFDWDADGDAEHVGIVSELLNEEESDDIHSIRTIEGNSSNQVKELTYEVTDDSILGYGVLPENPALSKATPGEANAAEANTEKTENDKKKVVRGAAPDNGISPQADGITILDEPLKLNETYIVKDVPRGRPSKVRIPFVPEYTHQYIIESTRSSGDTYGYLYDADGKQLTYNDDDAGHGQFRMTYVLEKDKTYYVDASWYSSPQSPNEIPVIVTLGNTHIYQIDGNGYAVCGCGDIAEKSGTVNEGINWYVDDDLTLHIGGTGDMPDYSNASNCPWNVYSAYIKKVVVANGITSIGNNTFNGKTKIESIELADSITKIGNNAFYNCDGLTGELNLPEGLTSIGTSAFNDCDNITSVTIPDGVTAIQNNIFYSCDKLETVIIPDSVTSIGNQAFYNCTKLNLDNLPSSLTTIGSEAFRYCDGITGELNLPEGVTSIGTSAFYDCDNITSVTIPDGVTVIQGSTFYSCDKLETVIIPDGVTSIGNGAFSGCTKLKLDNLPSSLTMIGSEAFRNCDGLTGELNLPEGVTSIGTYAFYDCDNITSVTISDGVTVIQGSTFYSCDKLENIIIPDGVTSIGSSAFYNCTKLKFDNLPSSLTTIGNSTFYNCDGITGELNLPEGVTSIGTSAFYDCDNITSVTIPDGVTVIQGSTFYSCDKLETVIIPDGVTSIGNSAFSGCTELKLDNLPSSLTTIGSYAFNNCDGLTGKLNLPESLTSIGASAFNGCDKLRNVELSNDAQTIGEKAFSNCESLNTVTISGGVQSIDTTAFYNSVVKEIEWNVTGDTPVFTGSGSDVRVKGEGFTLKPGRDAEKLNPDDLAKLKLMGMKDIDFKSAEYITLPDMGGYNLPTPIENLTAGDYYADEFGVLYRIESDKATLVYCPPDIGTEYTIPEMISSKTGTDIPVTKIAGSAFKRADELSSITVTKSEDIDVASYAFAGAKNLSSINGEEYVNKVKEKFKSTGVQAFEGTLLKGDNENESVSQSLHDKSGDLEAWVDFFNENSEPFPDGKIELYTGEYLRPGISISSQKTTDVIRIYIHFDGDGYKIDNRIINQKQTFYAGSSPVYNCTLRKADAPDTYYYEITDIDTNGKTIKQNEQIIYPTPDTGGGKAVMWIDILTGEENETLGNEVRLDSSESIKEIEWITKKDLYPVRKSANNTVYMAGDVNGGAYFSELRYTITTQRSSATLEKKEKDYITSMDFTDSFKLPSAQNASENQQAVLHQEIIDAIENGTWWRDSSNNYYAPSATTSDGKRLICSLSGNNAYINSMEYDAENRILITKWTTYNDNMATEISTGNQTFNFGSQAVYVESPQSDVKYEFENKITETAHYSYSGDEVSDSTVSGSYTTKGRELSVSKTLKSGSNYFGGKLIWNIAVKNPGAFQNAELDYLSDKIPEYYYLSSGQIAELFNNADKDGHLLTITISNGTICSKPEAVTVTGVHGETGTTSYVNAGLNAPHSGMAGTDSSAIDSKVKIVITKAESGGVKLEFDYSDNAGDDGVIPEDREITCEANADAIQEALDEAGFFITRATTYAVRWDLPKNDDGVFILEGGRTIEKEIPATTKDSFMMSDGDKESSCSGSNSNIYNYVYAYKKDGNLKSSYEYHYIYNEFSVSKSASVAGDTLSSNTKLAEGDIIDYTPSFWNRQVSYHPGYDTLPFIDHMRGAQAVLAPKHYNLNKDWSTGLDIYTDKDGVEYYILDKPGVYKNVRLNSYTADHIEVKASSAGLDTLIYWYFIDFTLDAQRTTSLPYKALVCPNRISPGALNYTVSNECWLNDHEAHRLYNRISDIGGTIFKFEKEIVDEPGDKKEGVKRSVVHEGETVNYRFQLVEQETDTEVYLPGNVMKDLLPNTPKGFSWNKENVKVVSYEPGTDDSTVEVSNKDSWYISEKGENGRQYIIWEDDFLLIYKGTANIYVQLTYPSDTDNADNWIKYCDEYGESGIDNVLYISNVSSGVHHDLSAKTRAYLQKGVYSVGYRNRNDYSYVYYTNNEMENRLYYQNDDVCYRYVRYYVTIYNDSGTRLYLTELQDNLPKGFTYYKLLGGSTSTASGTYSVPADGSGNHKSCNIAGSTTTNDDGTQKVTFNFSKTTLSDSVKYDADKDRCYLEKGDYIDFYYDVRTNDVSGSEDYAVNSIAMPFDNYNEGGLSVADKQFKANAHSDWITNDGGCEKINNASAALSGFTGGNGDTEWLVSDVTVQRDTIKPGITKELTSVTSQGGVTSYGVTSANPSDTLNWTLIAENAGHMNLTDYVITDVMPSPYMFTGDVTLKISSGTRSVLEASNGSLFKLSFDGDSKENLRIIVTPNTDDGTPVEITPGGEAKEIEVLVRYGRSGSSYIYDIKKKMQVAVAFDERDNAVLSMHFQDSYFSIPEINGKAELTLSTKRIGSNQENRVMSNVCYITPTGQTWDHNVSQGNYTNFAPLDSLGIDMDSSVRNSAPVTLSYGYTTAAKKYINDKNDVNNQAVSDSGTKFILLDGSRKTFTYTLEVDNTNSPSAFENLVLIDNLPEVGDYSTYDDTIQRNSEFKVNFSNTPNIDVKVKQDGGKSYEQVDSKYYTVEYSDAVVDVEKSYSFSDEDKKGAGYGDGWSTELKPTSRSIRITIRDPYVSGSNSAQGIMPKGCSVQISFDAVIDEPDSVEPGEIAWNNFGYHYNMKNDSSELESQTDNVGLKAPTVPEIQKLLQDEKRQPFNAEEDETFRFVLYQGNEIRPESGNYIGEEELYKKLTDGGRKFTTFNLKVEKGNDRSEIIKLKELMCYEWSESGGLKVTENLFTWDNNKRYSIVEFVDNPDYIFASVNRRTNQTYQFTYVPSSQASLNVINTRRSFELMLDKTDETGSQHLSGAYFGLYSPDLSDAISDEAYNALTLEEKPAKTLVYPAAVDAEENNTEATEADNPGGSEQDNTDTGQTYYLCAVEKTAAGGGLKFAELLRDKYVLVELKAPDGYNLDKTPRLIERTADYKDISIAVQNEVGYELPETGGSGTIPYNVAGLLLMIFAACLMYKIKGKRG